VPDTELRLEVDGDCVSGDDLKTLVELQVEESLEVADAATLVARLEADAGGEWTSILDPLLTPSTPVVAQVSRGDVTYRFEGRATEASWTIAPEGASRLSVTAVDRTVDLDLEEKVVAWPGSSDSAIAETILSSYGFATDVEKTPDGPDPDVHVVLQRGSDLAFLRELATKWGFATFLEATESRIVGHFGSIDPLADPQGELSLGFGPDAQKLTATANFVEGRRVKVSRIPALSDAAQSADSAGDDQAQGSHTLGGVATVLLTPDDVAGEVDPASTAEALARRSAFGVELTVELDTERVGFLLRARKPVLVRGLGSELSGRWLVQRVRHVVTLERHRQQVTLVRNALGLSGDEPFGSTGGLGGLL
jgi:hypothetical protein